MQPPAVRYVTTRDGVRLAYTVSGSGPPAVVLTDPSVSHVELEWSQPILRDIYGTLAEKVTLIRLDVRGTGLSERVKTVGPDTIYGEIRAVVEELGLTRYILAGVQIVTPAAIVYASRYPGEVTHLVLVDGCLSVMQMFTNPRLAAIVAAGQADWVTGTEAIGTFTFGAGHEESFGFGEYVRECIDPSFFPLAMSATATHDATPVASQVRAPTLVIKHSANTVSMEIARALVSAVPNASLVTLPGLWADEPAAFAGRITRWVLETPPAPEIEPAVPDEAQPDVRVILFTDIVGHTQMMERVGDARGRGILRDHERITRDVLGSHGGHEVKTMGDGFMASFTSATRGLDCAIALQRAFAEYSETHESVSIRAGLNAGEPIEEDGDLFGATVIIASRIAGQASGGEILVSDVIRGLLAGKGYLFADRGPAALRGFEDPVHVYEARWRG